jgi:hypothetical protein
MLVLVLTLPHEGRSHGEPELTPRGRASGMQVNKKRLGALEAHLQALDLRQRRELRAARLSARAGNRRFWRLSHPHAHTNCHRKPIKCAKR